jgi:putative tryptophan/tyrosine transport system substrate-binding protein
VHAQTASLPIVFVMASDPVGSGVAASHARPGGNVTGFTNFEPSIAGKWLELLKEIAPSVKRVAIIVHPETPASMMFQPAAEGAARWLGMQLTVASVRDAGEIERAITTFAADPNGALICTPHAVTGRHRKMILALAERHRLPAIYPWRDYVEADGGLSRTESMQRTGIGMRPRTWTGSSGEQRQENYRFKRRLSSSW